VQNPETKLWVSKHLGGREKEDWLSTLYDLDSRLDHAYPLPLFISDDWEAIKEALTEVYGIEYLPVHDGRGRPYSRSRWAVRPDLKYAQVVRLRDERGNLKRVRARIVYGDPVDVKASLLISGSKSIATSSSERQNLSIRNYGKRFSRKTICFSKEGEYLASYLEILHTWFNFIKKHASLRIRSQEGTYIHRTPAMVQGLAERPLTWEGILRWRLKSM